jgi:hypothetical protein
MHGEQRLVGGDHVLAVPQGRLHQAPRHAGGAADQLDHDVDVARHGQRQRILLPAHAVKIDVALLGFGACAHRDELEAAAAAQRQQAIVLGQQLDHTGTDGAQPGNADLQGRIHWGLIR